MRNVCRVRHLLVDELCRYGWPWFDYVTSNTTYRSAIRKRPQPLTFYLEVRRYIQPETLTREFQLIHLLAEQRQEVETNPDTAILLRFFLEIQESSLETRGHVTMAAACSWHRYTHSGDHGPSENIPLFPESGAMVQQAGSCPFTTTPS